MGRHLSCSLLSLSGFMSSSSTQMECEEEGIALVEIFNIIYKGSTPELKPKEQHGTIKISSREGVLYVYKVDKIDESMSSVKYLDYIPVTAKVPFCAFCPYIDMHFDLFNGAYKAYARLDMDFESDAIGFDELSIKSDDSTGEILVRIGSFGNATAAKLKVKVYLGDSASTYVYGVICATNSKFDFPRGTSVLFAKKQENGIQLQPDGEIPLSKSCVAVPMGSDLYVDIALNINGADHRETMSFPARGTGFSANPIHLSSDSKIQVLVDWNFDEDWIISNYNKAGEDMMNVG